MALKGASLNWLKTDVTWIMVHQLFEIQVISKMPLVIHMENINEVWQKLCAVHLPNMMLPFGLTLRDTTPIWLAPPTDEDDPELTTERLKADDDGPGCGCEQFSSCCFIDMVESLLFGGDMPRGTSGSANFLIWCITPKERERSIPLFLSPHNVNLLVHNFIIPLQTRKLAPKIRLKSSTMYRSVRKHSSHCDNLTNNTDNLNAPRCSKQLWWRL